MTQTKSKRKRIVKIDPSDGIDDKEASAAGRILQQRQAELATEPFRSILWAQNAVRTDLRDVDQLASRCHTMKEQLGVVGLIQGLSSSMTGTQMKNILEVIKGEGLLAGVTFPEYNIPVRDNGEWSIGAWKEFLRYGLDGEVEYMWICDEPYGHGLTTDDLTDIYDTFKKEAEAPLLIQFSGEIPKNQDRPANAFSAATCDIASYQKLAAQWDGKGLTILVFLWEEFQQVITESSQIVRSSGKPSMPIDIGLQCIGHPQGHKRRTPSLEEFELMLCYIVSRETLAIAQPDSIRLQMCYSPNDQYDNSFLLMNPEAEGHRELVRRLPEFWGQPLIS